jgi:hypothetical protein
MNRESLPRYYPRGWGWLWKFFDWFWINWIVGGIALLIAAVVIAISSGPPKMPADLSLSLVVLAMTNMATGIDSLKQYQAKPGQDIVPWLQRVFFLLLIFGAILAVISLPSDILRSEKIDTNAVGTYCLYLLFATLPVAFVAHAFGLKNRDAEVEQVFRVAFAMCDPDRDYYEQAEAREERLQQAMTAQSEYMGAKL